LRASDGPWRQGRATWHRHQDDVVGKEPWQQTIDHELVHSRRGELDRLGVSALDAAA
jgi:hypothetical protein